MMITEEEAREFFLKRFEEAYARTGCGGILCVQGHSARAAGAARKIARAMTENGVDTVQPRVAYVAGLLHDIGKTSVEWDGLDHAILGYRLLMEKGWAEPARVALTHTWYGYARVNYDGMWARLEKDAGVDEARFVREFMAQNEMTDLDLLIQLVDNMAHHRGIMTVSDRFGDILVRHNLEDAGVHLKELYDLKVYFDEKCGFNIYELFKSDIIDTTMREPNVFDGEYKFNWRKDEI